MREKCHDMDDWIMCARCSVHKPAKFCSEKFTCITEGNKCSENILRGVLTQKLWKILHAVTF